MPELPDLVRIEALLSERLSGARITSVRVQNPIVLRSLGGGAADSFLVGAVIEQISLRGPFVVFSLSGERLIIVHPMLAGRFSLDGAFKKALCLLVGTDRGDLGYHDDRQMGKVYLARVGQEGKIPKFADQGIDVLSPEFDAARLDALMGKTRKQVRVFLMDQTQLSSIGNAYADEILFAAGIHPKTTCNQLSVEDRSKLHDSIVQTLRWGIHEVERAAAPLHEKVRGHMKVRNRKGEACPKCGATIRRESVLGHDTFFCPQCQPPTRRSFIDWEQR